MQMDRTRSWLAALPNDVSPFGHMAIAPVAALCVLVIVLTAMILTAHLSLSSAAGLLVVISAGCVMGSLIGWVLPHGAAPSNPGSWYVTVRRVRDQWEIRPSILALGYWGVACARVWNRPKVRARSALLILLALPMDVAAAVALAAVAASFVGLYLLSLLLAIVRVSFAASWWLAPTSIALSRFTLSMMYLALLQQIAICVLVLCAVCMLGGSLAMQRGSLVAVGWIVLFCIVSLAACTYAHRSGIVAHSAVHRWLR
jgi:hypothetical protein